MTLPPPEAKTEDVMAYVDRLEDECAKDPNRIAWEMNKQRWLDLYTGNHWASALINTLTDGREPEEVANRPAATIVKMVYNRVMNAVLAHLAGQVGNSPKVVFNARESGEPPIYYLNGYVQNPIVQQMAMQAGANSERTQQVATIYGPDHPETQNTAAIEGMSVPLQEPFVSQLKAMIDQGRILSMQARMQGLPVPQDIVPPEALVEVTDQSKAQLRQVVFDALWEQCGGTEATNENILNKKILGWGATLVESDRTKIEHGLSPITLTNLEGSQVYVDPKTSSFRPGQYKIMREPVSVEEGIAKYPEAAQTIKDKSAAGTLGSRLTRNATGGRLASIDFGRDMAVVRTLWILNWPYPMDPDEALERGKVQIQQVPDESFAQGPTAATAPNQSRPEDGSEGTGVSPLDGSIRPGTGSEGQASTGISGEVGSLPLHPGQTQGTENVVGQTSPATEIAQPTRSAFIHSDTGQEVTPTLPDGTQHPAWPIVYGMREIRDVERQLIYDRRCRLPQPPLEININIPVPFSPYGIGEPDRLDGLQMAINRVLSDAVTHHRYDAYPPEIRLQTVADALGKSIWAQRQRLQPNSAVNVPNSLAQELGGDLSKLVQHLNLPPMPAESWKLLEFLVDAIDKEAGNTEQMQGIAPSGSSGAWVANLQAAASQVMQVTSMSTESWLKNIVRQFLYFIDHVMTIEDIQKYTSKYPPAILAALHSPQKSPYIDVSVEIQSGSAAAKQGQTGMMLQAKAQGIQVSEPEIMRRMNLDPDDQLKQQGDFKQKMLETGAAEAMPQQPEQPAPAQSNAA